MKNFISCTYVLHWFKDRFTSALGRVWLIEMVDSRRNSQSAQLIQTIHRHKMIYSWRWFRIRNLIVVCGAQSLCLQWIKSKFHFLLFFLLLSFYICLRLFASSSTLWRRNSVIRYYINGQMSRINNNHLETWNNILEYWMYFVCA